MSGAPARRDPVGTAGPPAEASAASPRRRRRAVVPALAAILFLPLAAAHWLLRASLPQLDGTVRAAGPSAAVTVERDALGIPTVQGATRADVAFGTGFVHAQDRFFQMDLARRLAAGELAGLFGAAALEQDRKARIFRFREVARQVLAQAAPEQRAVLDAYVRGVNAGLASLAARPWEYWVLGAAPAPWRAEDSILVVHAMWWDLQYAGFRREKLRRLVDARLGGTPCGPSPWKCATQFFYPRGTEWDGPTVPAPAGGEPLLIDAAPAVPSAADIDLRGAAPAEARRAPMRVPAAGSNNWAVGGALTGSGAALVASDPHLGLRVPAVWYRIRMRVAGEGGGGLDLNGVTLAGAPVLVEGSNGRIAWGFTNSYGDWQDLVPGPCDDPRLETVTERIAVRGGEALELRVESGPAGILFEREPDGRTCWFAQWLARVPEATNLHMLALETAGSVREALDLAPGIGIPHQNAVIGDREGHIGWAIFGRVPRALDGSRAAGTGEWTDAQDHPQVMDPPSGRIWSANARVTDDPRQELAIGGDEAAVGAEYDLGARAGQIRDRLLSLDGRAGPADMLRIQLDDEARFLARWRELLLGLLDERAVEGRPDRAELRRLVSDWGGRAAADSAGYRIVRTWRTITENAAWSAVLTALGIDSEDAPPPAQFEGPLWRLIEERPPHLLPAPYTDWNEFLLAQADATLARLAAECPSLASCTWGARRPVRIRHPLSRALPQPLARALDMPTVELPGDHDMPRVQDGAFGASLRFAVSPGFEREGYLHVAGGQSGHPLSPFYRAGFREWARGEPLPFLPGPARHRLVLEAQ